MKVGLRPLEMFVSSMAGWMVSESGVSRFVDFEAVREWSVTVPSPDGVSADGGDTGFGDPGVEDVGLRFFLRFRSIRKMQVRNNRTEAPAADPPTMMAILGFGLFGTGEAVGSPLDDAVSVNDVIPVDEAQAEVVDEKEEEGEGEEEEEKTEDDARVEGLVGTAEDEVDSVMVVFGGGISTAVNVKNRDPLSDEDVGVAIVSESLELLISIGRCAKKEAGLCPRIWGEGAKAWYTGNREHALTVHCPSAFTGSTATILMPSPTPASRWRMYRFARSGGSSCGSSDMSHSGQRSVDM